jgi:GH15 family glucan-1,4-alpha-glucosidase
MYPPIEDHGIIGDLRTVALVSLNGSIDFFCPLRFDGPTLFASLLDAQNGGHCTIQPGIDDFVRKQLYLPDTNVLVTRFLARQGVAEVVDFMPLGEDLQQSTIIRQVRITRGELPLRFECRPAFNYASEAIRPTATDDGVLFCSKDSGALFVRSNVSIPVEKGRVDLPLNLKRDEQATIVLSYVNDGSKSPEWSPARHELALKETIEYWHGWVAACNYRGRWRETVLRSALVLKLLTYDPSGAIVAAPTFGLPEDVGGVRNWDYRYTWLRDAAFTLNAFLSLGFRREALAFMSWIKEVATKNPATAREEQKMPLQVMYGIEGESDLEEREITSLKGYRDSRPVRVGNAAYTQLQLDGIGGAFTVALFEVNAGRKLEYERWNKMCHVLRWLEAAWEQPDQGIWETRGAPLHFLHSKLMVWVAFDRAIKIAQSQSLPAPLQGWLETRDRVYRAIHTDYWNDELETFTQSKGGLDLDASALLMVPVGFISPADPRWLSTLDAVTERLSQDTAVLRYDTKTGVDGLPGTEGAFAPCSFWYVNALAMSGRVQQARISFEKVLGYANHLGLFAEEFGLKGEHLGNFPQALTHLALILCAVHLNDALEGKGDAYGMTEKRLENP